MVFILTIVLARFNSVPKRTTISEALLLIVSTLHSEPRFVNRRPSATLSASLTPIVILLPCCEAFLRILFWATQSLDDVGASSEATICERSLEASGEGFLDPGPGLVALFNLNGQPVISTFNLIILA
jgi:hypothetical protein